MNTFDIIGPVMVGPSSSHTAGAARLGKVARMLLGEEPEEAHIKLHGSFAKTYRGHGTDMALAGGLLGFEVDDIRIKDSLNIAKAKGIKISFEAADLGQVHPNTVCIRVAGSTKTISIMGSSIGGGNITVTRVDDIEVDFSGEYHTLVVSHEDKPGVIAAVTGVLASRRVNIAFMKVFRTVKRGKAIMVIELDQSADEEGLALIKQIPGVLTAVIIYPVAGE